MRIPLENVIAPPFVRTHVKANNEGTPIETARIRYLSENSPEQTTQIAAKTYGGALRPCALAALKPMFLTMVGSDRANPYKARVSQMAMNAMVQVCTD
jgi:hypothetical protein